MSTLTKTSIKNILDAAEIKPFRIQYYCERRDPEFESKMHDVLVVYKQVEMLFDENGVLYVPAGEHDLHTVSYDEKPGIQAISVTAPDLRPREGKGSVQRDKEDHFSKVPRDEFILLVAPDIDNGKPKTPINEEILDKVLSIQYKLRRHVTMIAFDGYQNNAIADYAMSRDVELHMIRNLNGRRPVRQLTVLEYLDKHPETPKGALLIDPGKEAKESVKDMQEVFGFPVRFYGALAQ